MREPLSIVADTRCHTGEGPLYHPGRGVVYWVDTPRGYLFEYDPIDDDYVRALDYDGVVGGFTVQANGDFLLFCDRGRVVPWSPDDGFGDPVITSVAGEVESRFNDIIADPAGRVFAGTLSTEKAGGTLYRLDTDGSLATVETNAAVPNGLGFTPDHESLYFTETDADAIYRCGYDKPTGGVSDPELFVDTSDVAGRPDGMAVDARGHVWVAFWDGGRVTRYGPDGTELERIALPVEKVSAIAFGGPEYGTAYVATAVGPDEGDDEPGTHDEEGTGAGALFAVDPQVSGTPQFRSRIDV